MSSENQKAAVVFVHGLFSSGGKWDPLLRLLRHDKQLSASYDWVPFSYSSPFAQLNPFRRIPNFDDIATRLTTLIYDSLASRKRLVLVSHSQGGLIIQRFLSKMLADGRGHDLMSIRRILMFACPNDGSEFALSLRTGLFSIFWHSQERELRPFSEDIQAVRARVLSSIVHVDSAASDRCPIPVAAYAGESDGIVRPESAIRDFPTHGVIPGDHFSLVEPESVSAPVYGIVRQGLIAALREQRPRVSDWRAKARALAHHADQQHADKTYAALELAVPDAPQPMRVIVEAGGFDRLRNVDIVVSSENVYFEMAKPYKPSTSGVLRNRAAIKNGAGEIVDDLMFNELNSWLRANGRHGLQVAAGTVAPTGPGQLIHDGIKRVYHAAIVVPRSGTNDYDVAAGTIERAVQNVFRLAGEERRNLGLSLNSIAIPLFGAGRGSMNPEVSLERILRALRVEFTRDPSWTIHLCTWKNHDTDIVLERLQQLASGSIGWEEI